MTDEKWQQIKGMVKDKFPVLGERTEDLPEDGPPGTVEVLEFVGPLGKMRLERTDSPLVTGKKTIGSRRIGSTTAVEYLYSDTERVHKFRAFRWDESSESWVEMEKIQDNFVI